MKGSEDHFQLSVDFKRVTPDYYYMQQMLLMQAASESWYVLWTQM